MEHKSDLALGREQGAMQPQIGNACAESPLSAAPASPQSRRGRRIGIIAGAVAALGILGAAYATFIGLPGLVRIAPVSIVVHSSSTLPPEVQALEAQTAPNLFDRDTTSGHVAYADQSIDLALDNAREIHAIKVYGPAPYVLSVEALDGGSWTPISGLSNIKLSNLAAGWNTLQASQFLTSSNLRLVLTLASVNGGGNAGGNGKGKGSGTTTTTSGAIPEIEIWAAGEHSLVNGSGLVAAALAAAQATASSQTPMPAQARVYTATPNTAVVGGTLQTFSVTVDRPAARFKRAWLSYEAFGLANWVSPVRSINGQALQGGAFTFNGDYWTPLTEPINPNWLVPGKNTVSFTLPPGLSGSYSVRNVRIVGELDDGNDPIARVTTGSATSKTSSETDAPQLIDGDLTTGWTPYNDPHGGNPTLTLYFDKPTQLDNLNLDLVNSLSGTVNVDLLVGGQWQSAGLQTINGKKLSAGWNTIAGFAPVAADALRLTFQSGQGSAGEILEVAATGSGTGTAFVPAINVLYPDAGQFYGRQAYIRGYLTVPDDGSGPAVLTVANTKGTQTQAAADGSFGILVSKDDVGYASQTDTEPWQVTLLAKYPDGQTLTQTVKFIDARAAADAHGLLPNMPNPGMLAAIAGGDASIEIPPGALDKPLPIKITPLAQQDLPTLDPGMTNVTPYPNRGYRFTPHGTHFKKDVKVTLPFDPKLVPPGLTTADIKTYYFDTQRGHWVELTKYRMDGKRNKLTSLTNHFTDMINATLVVPDHPETASYNATQMKDIKAADPGAGINLIAPPTPNNMGDARLSYPIEIPKGRQGMQPQLAISYSSGGGNGWLGMGWDISTPSITIDTRWGVPKYDLGKRKEIYLLNGAQLVEVSSTNGYTEYRPRIEGAFERIRRYGSGPGDYWWVVTDKQGTRSVYGGDATARLRSYDLSHRIFTWYLSRTVDSNGNTVDYAYDIKDEANQNGVAGATPGENATYTYLKEIRYTGHVAPGQADSAIRAIPDKPTGNTYYRVRFEREAGRPDHVVNGRPAFKTVLDERLKTIDVERVAGSNASWVRAYVLTYAQGDFFKTLLTKISQYGNKYQPATPGVALAEHTFEYFTMPTANGGYNGFAAETAWSVPGLSGGLSHNVTDDMGGGLFLGFMIDDPDIHVGGGANFGQNKTSTDMVMADLNGDGLPDFMPQGGMYYKNQWSQAGQSGMGFSALTVSGGIGGLGYDQGSTRSNTFGVHTGQHDDPAADGAATTGGTDSKVTGTQKLEDINGDGWPDLLSTDSGTLQVQLNNGSGYGPPIPWTGGVSVVKPVSNEEMARLKNAYPLMDAVVAWDAPFAGTVGISGVIGLTQAPNTAAGEDGVRIDVYKGASTTPLWETTLTTTKAIDLSTISALQGLSVQAHDAIYLKVNGISDVAHDLVQSDLHIAYTSVSYTDASGATHTLNDPAGSAATAQTVTGMPQFSYGSSAEFAIAAVAASGAPGQTDALNPNSAWTPPYKGTVNITNVVSKQIVAEDMRFRMIKVSYDSRGNVTGSQVLYDKTVAANDAPSFNDTLTGVSVDTTDKVFVDISLPKLGAVPADHYLWKPEIRYTNVCTLQSTGNIDVPGSNTGTQLVCNDLSLQQQEMTDRDLPGASAFPPQGAPTKLYIFNPTPILNIYPFASTAPVQAWVAPKDGTVRITTASYKAIPTTSDVHVKIQTTNQAILEYSYTAAQVGSGGGQTMDVPVTAGQRLFFGVQSKDAIPASKNPSSPNISFAPTVTYLVNGAPDPSQSYTPPVNIDSLGWGPYSNTSLNGFYRHFAYVAWNGNFDWDPTKLLFPNYSSASDAQTGLQQNPPYFKRFRPLAFGNALHPDTPVWTLDKIDAFVGTGSMQPSRAAGNLTQFVSVPQGAGISELTRTKSSTNTTSAGLGFASYSQDTGDSNALSDLIDLNGDRYPDFVGDGEVVFNHGASGGFDGASTSTTIIDGAGISHTRNQSYSIGYAFGSMLAKHASNSTIKGMLSTMPTINGGYSSSETTVDFVDINGDGLPDRVSRDQGAIIVRLNLGGDRFGARETWAAPSWGVDVTAPNLPSFLPINTPSPDVVRLTDSVSVSASEYIGYSASGSRVLVDFRDINGDGLPDLVLKRNGDDHFTVHLNLGDRFDPSATNWYTPAWSTQIGRGATTALYGGNDTISYNENWSTNAGYNQPFPIVIPLPFVTIYIWIEPNVSIAHGEGGSALQLMDINGDGFPDQVYRSSGSGQVLVKLNNTGKTNLLKAVNRPLHGRIDLDYVRSGNVVDYSDPAYKVDMPSSKWVLASAITRDGQGNSYPETFRYFESGYHDRIEREDYGYGHIQDIRADGATTDEFFHNQDYTTKGLLYRSVYRDKGGRLYTRTEQVYDVLPIVTGVAGQPDVLFPSLSRVTTHSYEGMRTAAGDLLPGTRLPDGIKQSGQSYTYDTIYGNVQTYTDLGDLDVGDDDVEAYFNYFACADSYIVGKASSIDVIGNGQLMRQRKGEMPDCVTGNITQIKQILADASTAVTDLGYDSYGSLSSVTGPANAAGQRYRLDYTYDDQVHTYPITVKDNMYNGNGYESQAAYDYDFGVPVNTTDINGNNISYVYDDFGRTIYVNGPYDQPAQINSDGTVANYTLAFTYNQNAPIPYATTMHVNKDAARVTGTPIETVTFIDGLKRAIQVKKSGAIDQGNGTSAPMMIVSGRVKFDEMGRVGEQRYPVTEPLGQETTFNPALDGVAATTTEYDVMDRAVTTTLPDKTFTQITYGFGPDRSRATQFLTTVVDANGKTANRKETYRNVRQLITSVAEYNNDAPIWTSYGYDPLGEITLVEDAQNNKTIVAYDNLGRRTSIDNPDTGKTTMEYDPASNLIHKITANLAAAAANGGKSKSIDYIYDYNRLSQILYPDNTGNNVTYDYGGPGAPDNQAGRVTKVTDAAGTEEMGYGRLGETVWDKKTIASKTQGKSAHSPEVYTTQYQYDTFGRLMVLTLPDGEVLTHAYDAGGNLQSITGVEGAQGANTSTGGMTTRYLQTLLYDKFEQRTYLKLGNGVETRYTYRRDNRRLKTLTSQDAVAGQFQNLSYGYDAVGNIMNLANQVKIAAPSSMGGPTNANFRYDDLYRLVHADNSYQYAPNKTRNYTLDMQYDDIHNIVNKTQADNIVQGGGKPITQKATTYNWDYCYDSLKCASQSGQMRPHAPIHIGNRTFTYDPNGNQTGWTNDSNGTRRTILWDEENRISHIDDNGERSYYTYDASGNRTIKVSRQGQTVYVNQYYVVRNRSIVSKHIFANNTRIATHMEMGNGNTGAYKGNGGGGAGGSTGGGGGAGQGHGNNGNAYGQDKVHGQSGEAHGQSGMDHGNSQAAQVSNGNGNSSGSQGNGHSSQGHGNSGGNGGGNVDSGEASVDTSNLPSNSEAGLENALANGKGHKYGIYKHLEKEGDTVTGGEITSSTAAGATTTVNGQSSFTYYYHPDHLGSTGFVTDANGKLYEHMEYFPFGESWVDEHSNTLRTPYLFTGKEYDQETGLYYFGARYYDPRTSVWQSADPILGKYLAGHVNGGVYRSDNLDLYSYSLNSPLNIVDPDGNAGAKFLKLLAKIAKKYKNLECHECAKEMIDAAEQHGVSGKLVEVTGKERTKLGHVWSDRKGKSVSANDNHVGVEVDGKVYDNHTPEGLERQKWEDDLHHPYGKNVEETPFSVEEGFENAKNKVTSLGAAVGAVVSDEWKEAKDHPLHALYEWSPAADVHDATKIDGLGGCNSAGRCTDEIPQEWVDKWRATHNSPAKTE